MDVLGCDVRLVGPRSRRRVPPRDGGGRTATSPSATSGAWAGGCRSTAGSTTTRSARRSRARSTRRRSTRSRGRTPTDPAPIRRAWSRRRGRSPRTRGARPRRLDLRRPHRGPVQAARLRGRVHGPRRGARTRPAGHGADPRDQARLLGPGARASWATSWTSSARRTTSAARTGRCSRRRPTAPWSSRSSAELFSFIRARTSAKVFLHSCGAVRELIPDLIEIGVDILNPVQVSAAGHGRGGAQARVRARPGLLGRRRRHAAGARGRDARRGPRGGPAPGRRPARGRRVRVRRGPQHPAQRARREHPRDVGRCARRRQWLRERHRGRLVLDERGPGPAERRGRLDRGGRRPRRRGGLAGPLVAPGFIDVHVHGWGGHDAHRGLRAALSGMATGAPPARRDLVPAHGAVAARARDPALRGPGARLDARPRPPTGRSRSGSTWRGRSSRPARKGAQNPALLRTPAAIDADRRGRLAGRAADHDDRARAARGAGAHRAAGGSGSSRPSATPRPRWRRPGPATRPAAATTTHLFNAMTGVDHRAPGPRGRGAHGRRPRTSS